MSVDVLQSETQLALLKTKWSLIEDYRILYAQQPEGFAAKLADELSQLSKILGVLGRLDEAFAASQEAAALYQRVLEVSVVEEITDGELPQCTCDGAKNRSVENLHQECA
ncbi:unnamed protein product [Rhizoctonia solani]|uniref:Uncharacterized protein n=1 Tax=Rhizoctonia solani TaxID=456999 RepID=A0A8H3HI68_9AGAM|nr:unnamed protein product [Rhizoctonia solani]